MVIVRGRPETEMVRDAVAASTVTPSVPDALGSEDFGSGEAARLTEVGRTRLAISPIVTRLESTRRQRITFLPLCIQRLSP